MQVAQVGVRSGAAPMAVECLEECFSRICRRSTADVFDALTSERPYKKAWTQERSAEYIKANAGIHFDPACIVTFFDQWSAVLEIRQRFKDEDSSAIDSLLNL